jgi:hypothetical protein
LSMVSIAPIQTSCGAFHVYVTLDGKQPVTKMRIHRTQKEGGSFRAPLAANVRMAFVPVQGTSPRKLVLKGRVEFPPVTIPWRFPDGKVLKPLESAVVDTNGDLRPDTRVPGNSNFMAGYPPGIRSINAAGCYCVCHRDEGKYHCSATGGFDCSTQINCWE